MSARDIRVAALRDDRMGAMSAASQASEVLYAALRRFDELGAPVGVGLGAGLGLLLGAEAVHLGGATGGVLGALALSTAAALALRAPPLAAPGAVPEDEAPGEPAPEPPAPPAPAPEPPAPPRLREPLEMIELPAGAGGAFAMGKTPVTQEIYRTIMDHNPGEPEGADLPVNNVAFYDAIAFCNRLSLRAGLQPCYQREGDTVSWDRSANGYRLPTEAEWEYAARAGTTTAYSFGDDPKQLGAHAWFSDNSQGQVHPVAQKEPNPWGLYDMHGNVWEWCWDVWSLPDNLPLSNDRQARVVRGGSFVDVPWILRSAVRNRNRPEVRLGNLGFRCVRGVFRQR